MKMISLGPRPESPITMFIGEKYESNPLSVIITILNWFRSSKGQEWITNSNPGGTGGEKKKCVPNFSHLDSSIRVSTISPYCLNYYLLKIFL